MGDILWFGIASIFVKINLLPLEYRSNNRILKKLLGCFVFGVGISFFIWQVGSFILRNEVTHMQRNNHVLQQQLVSREQEVNNFAKLKAQIKIPQLIKQKIASLQSQQQQLYLFMVQIPKAMPTLLYITAIQKQNRLLSIKGIAMKHDAIQDFIHKVQGQFAKTQLIKAHQKKDDIYFEIKTIL
jgi:Tfp pilus assembly protein PilN